MKCQEIAQQPRALQFLFLHLRHTPLLNRSAGSAHLDDVVAAAADVVVRRAGVLHRQPEPRGIPPRPLLSPPASWLLHAGRREGSEGWSEGRREGGTGAAEEGEEMAA